ncbi:C-3 keto reductase [Phaffia rhodozyma]|uniref:3beta-hydroxysteroid 3-dehydrogenase n=1 Tax=Phaffia rhodozyma TaxID=264483 RepID=A0A0F7SEB4_PHARH|nr:C-3 keto reductase [Phaffia rhodozyma]
MGYPESERHQQDGQSGKDRLYIIITGANSGIGLGIATRILFQLAFTSSSTAPPPDSLPQQALLQFTSPDTGSSDLSCPFVNNSGITLILACRSKSRALEARGILFTRLRAECRNRGLKDSEGEKIVNKVEIVWEALDLSEMRSVSTFVDNVKTNYPYVTHLFNNAGVGAWAGIHWPSAFFECLTDPIKGMTDPEFKKQYQGWKSEKDGLGWVWQCNVFSHWCITKALLPHIQRSPFHSPRIIWTSSLLGSNAPKLNLSDLQCIESLRSYEESKRQVDLLCASLDRELASQPLGIRCITGDPAVTATEIFRPQLGFWLYQAMMFAFYFVRLVCNSQNHPISPMNGTITFVHLALLSASLIPTPSSSFPSSSTSKAESPTTPTDPPHTQQAFKFRSQADRWGNPYVSVVQFEWDEVEAGKLVDYMENLRQVWGKALGGLGYQS